MLRLLSGLGRLALKIGAIPTFLVMWFLSYYNIAFFTLPFSISDLYYDSSRTRYLAQIITVVLGALGGALMTGVVLGTMAVLYEIRDSLQLLAQREQRERTLANAALSPRREPKF